MRASGTRTRCCPSNLRHSLPAWLRDDLVADYSVFLWYSPQSLHSLHPLYSPHPQYSLFSRTPTVLYLNHLLDYYVFFGLHAVVLPTFVVGTLLHSWEAWRFSIVGIAFYVSTQQVWRV